MNNLFYPPLKRRDISEYYKSNADFYATYNCRANYNNIAKDCFYRCVYCDAHIDECGGEPFSLDHFRPRNIFDDKFGGILKIHPFNLHLSCQKCNVLKTNDWKGCVDTEDGETFISAKGYIDRFKADITIFLKVNNEGHVECINSSGPAKYMIGKLLLNRTNRVYIRKRREVVEKSKIVESILYAKNRKIIDDWKRGVMTSSQAMEKIEKLNALSQRYAGLKSTPVGK